MISFPNDFKKEEREEAEFWGWLTDRFPVEKELVQGLDSDLIAEEGLVLLTRNRISSLISRALQKGQQKIAQQLFELTKPVHTLEDYTRKSMRVGQGEYLELLFLKIKKDTSFSDVIVDILSKPMLNYLDNLEDQFGDVLSVKIQILQDKINYWREISPAPRFRNVEYSFIKMSKTKRVSILLGRTDEFVEKVVDLVKTIGYIENLPSDMYAGPDPVYIEFQEEWTRILEKQLRSGLNMDVYIDEDESEKLSFRLYGYAYISVDGVQLEELYQKIDYPIDSYIEKYCLYPCGKELQQELKKYKDYFNKFTEIVEKYGKLDLGIRVDLSKYHINVKSKKDFEVEYNQKYYDELTRKLKNTSEEILKEFSYYEYHDFNELIQKVMKEGNEMEYRLISQLFSINNAQGNLSTVFLVGKHLIEDEIAKYPVISYYTPNELIPLLSVILKKNNLYDLI